jgi:hypothetical protein
LIASNKQIEQQLPTEPEENYYSPTPLYTSLVFLSFSVFPKQNKKEDKLSPACE